MQSVLPLSFSRQTQVEAETCRYIKLASDKLARQFDPVTVVFDLRGKSAGMYRINRNGNVIRYNPFLFEKYFHDNFTNTVPHEVAHYLADQVYGWKNIRPHGIEWKQMMQVLGANPSRTAKYNLDGIPIRNIRYFDYQCACKKHQISSRRHYKIIRRQADYFCNKCNSRIMQAGNLD